MKLFLTERQLEKKFLLSFLFVVFFNLYLLYFSILKKCENGIIAVIDCQKEDYIVPFFNLGVPPTGLYFMLNGTIHFPGDSVLVSDIGPQPDNRNDSGSTLVCVTTNVNKACCRENDNNALTTSTMGAVGDWYYPDSTQVPRGSDGKQLKSSRIGYTHQVRLARSPDSTPPPGVYTCVVPEPVTGVLHNASITIDMGKLQYFKSILCYNAAT